MVGAHATSGRGGRSEAVMSERAAMRGPVAVGEEEGGAALLLANLAASTLASSLLIASSSQRLLLAIWAFLTASDSLLNQGGAAYFLLTGHQSSCLPLASSSLFFLVLLISFLASLSVSPSPNIPFYIHILLPFILALVVTTPFLFPQVAVATYFHNRQSCGFISLSRTHSIFTMILGFVFPLAILYYFSTKLYFPLTDNALTRNEKPVIVLISVCSVLLIPHIIQINITHVSVTLLKSNSEIETSHDNIPELLFIWLRYGFNTITPIAVLCVLMDVIHQWKQLYYLCFKNHSVMKYLNRKGKLQLLFTQKSTPILFPTEKGIMIKLNGTTKDIDVPFNIGGNLQVDSSTSAEFSTFSPEKNVAGRKKIVRFAHSVKEISMNTTQWDCNSD